MTSSKPCRKKAAFELGKFQVDPQRRSIKGPWGETLVEPKVMAVLLMLAERPGEVITRREFNDSVWVNEYGGDESLTRAISHLRRAFGDNHNPHTCIETIPRTGYRLVKTDAPVEATIERGDRSRLPIFIIVIFLALFIVMIFLAVRPGDETVKPSSNGQVSVVLAVLPFDSQSKVIEDVTLARGLANEILSALSINPSISVIAGNSSFQLQGNYEQNLEVLSQQANISHVIDGLVQRSPGGLQVGVRLIEARTGRVVWSDVVTRVGSEIYTIPTVVATEIQTVLGAIPIEADPRSQPPDPAVYEAYLHAKALFRETFDRNLVKAIRILEDVVSKDPGLSEAWAALAWARLDLAHVNASGTTDPYSEEPLGHLRAARREANTALAIDPGSVDALLVLVIIDLMNLSDNLVESESRILSLLARAPNHPNVNMRMGLFLMSVGRFQEAAIYMKTAFDLNPLSSLTGFYYATALYGSGQTGKARAYLENAGALDLHRRSYPWLIDRLLAGDFLAARDFFTPLEGDNVFYTKGLGMAENIDADSPRAIRLRSLIERLVTAAESADTHLDLDIGSDLVLAADDGLIPHGYTFALLAAAGQNNAAFDLAKERILLGEVWYREAMLLPAFSMGRKDPRVMELLETTGQLDYWLKTGKWPDFCSDQELPYDCEDLARRFHDKQMP